MARARDTRTEAGRGHRLSPHVRPERVALHVALDPERGRAFRGEVATTLELARGVSSIELHAVGLRVAGVAKPILMLEGFFKPADLELVAKHALTPVIHNPEQVEILKRSKLGAEIDVYLKVNSGMNRLGFGLESLRPAYNSVRMHPQVKSVSVMTHFADADGASGVKSQLAWLEEMVRPIEGLAHATRSLANSAGVCRYGEVGGDIVRPGIMLYGATPFPYDTAAMLGLEPVMTLHSRIIAVRDLAPNDSVGYGATYTAARAHRLGVVACGYADGYPRHAPNGTPVLVCGRKVRIAGRVSMDMITVDLTDVPEANVGSPVVLWGEGLPVDDVAAAASTVGYELLCALAPRVRMAATRVGRIDLVL